jgi:hypothetical protein
VEKGKKKKHPEKIYWRMILHAVIHFYHLSLLLARVEVVLVDPL